LLKKKEKKYDCHRKIEKAVDVLRAGRKGGKRARDGARLFGAEELGNYDRKREQCSTMVANSQGRQNRLEERTQSARLNSESS